MNRLSRRLLLCVVWTLGLVSCRSVRELDPVSGVERVPGTGDISFRLEWSGSTDMDLHVWGPDGVEIYHLARESPSGGQLDIDCNALRVCDSPIENVFWPVGEAPDGEYRALVRLYRRLPWDPRRVQYFLLVKKGETIVEKLEGWLGPVMGERSDPVTVRFDRSQRPSVVVMTEREEP